MVCRKSVVEWTYIALCCVRKLFTVVKYVHIGHMIGDKSVVYQKDVFIKRLEEVITNYSNGDGKGLTGNKIAEKIGVEPSTVSKIRNGSMQPKPEILCELCSLLDEYADYLLGLTDIPKHIRTKKTAADIVKDVLDTPSSYTSKKWIEYLLRIFLENANTDNDLDKGIKYADSHNALIEICSLLPADQAIKLAPFLFIDMVLKVLYLMLEAKEHPSGSEEYLDLYFERNFRLVYAALGAYYSSLERIQWILKMLAFEKDSEEYDMFMSSGKVGAGLSQIKVSEIKKLLTDEEYEEYEKYKEIIIQSQAESFVQLLMFVRRQARYACKRYDFLSFIVASGKSKARLKAARTVTQKCLSEAITQLLDSFK
jgi:transcriptional regulator with XRE-family HTH domain